MFFLIKQEIQKIYVPNYSPNYSPNYNRNYSPNYNRNYSPNYSPNADLPTKKRLLSYHKAAVYGVSSMARWTNFIKSSL